MNSKMKSCPYCAEDIKLEAIKCKHCGEFFKGSSELSPLLIMLGIYLFKPLLIMLVGIGVNGYGYSSDYLLLYVIFASILCIVVAIMVFSFFTQKGEVLAQNWLLWLACNFISPFIFLGVSSGELYFEFGIVSFIALLIEASMIMFYIYNSMSYKKTFKHTNLFIKKTVSRIYRNKEVYKSTLRAIITVPLGSVLGGSILVLICFIAGWHYNDLPKPVPLFSMIAGYGCMKELFYKILNNKYFKNKIF